MSQKWDIFKIETSKWKNTFRNYIFFPLPCSVLPYLFTLSPTRYSLTFPPSPLLGTPLPFRPILYSINREWD